MLKKMSIFQSIYSYIKKSEKEKKEKKWKGKKNEKEKKWKGKK